MRSIIIAAAIIIATGIAQARAPSTLTGTAHAKDGDGIAIGDVPDIRLNGIAAPEDNPTKVEVGGPESTANLKAFVDGKNVRCEFDGTTTRGRPVGICYLGGKDIGLYQVENGHARDCPRFSKGRYAQAEQGARKTRDLSVIYPLPGYCAPR